MVTFLDKDDVERLLPMRECLEVVSKALAGLARGEAFQPLRSVYRPPGLPGLLALMPAAWWGEEGSYLGLKVVGVFPGNRSRGEDAHQGAVLLLSGETGKLLAVVDASAITSIRTAAVSAIATRLLARPDAGTLALIGAGVQARAHLHSIAEVRSLREVRVSSRGGISARALQEELSPRFPFPIRAVGGVEEAASGADIVVTVTTSKDPILRAEWLAQGAHVNAVGSSVPSSRELDGRIFATCSLFADRRESLENESGDYLGAVREGHVPAGCFRAEIGDVLIGAHPGRTSAEEITLFKSLGLGIEDLAAASHAYRRSVALAG